ncbi:outer membrane beta-barrel protein [Parasediminibacterium sp. JCM 36343]|uniref:outer membrane beta-barrel protein n=1 Tax=Parasediminibacterium sp. JCM 36343 TaxID=3374279 RepID=UPI00397A9CE2
MYKYYLLALMLIFAASAFAQTKGILRGKLIDSVGKQSLKDASITVLDAQDSTLEVFGLSVADGSFEIKNVSFGSFLVQVSFEGYTPINRKATFSKDHPVVDLGDIYMKIKTQDLNEVVVQTSPINIKKDTIEYNAGSFKTKPNAVVEDLLKKLPGVEVAKDGTIKAQGEQVQRVLVDGKRFFGDDPKMATKNLPPDFVDKIQIYDAQSDQSAFSGFDDGTRTKTINITTKKDKRKGIFGKAMAGGGDQGRYESSLNLNVFNNNQQISILGEGNNVNRQAFTVQDILGAVGRGGGGRGNGGGGGGAVANVVQGLGAGNSSNGITTTWAGGINYRDVWGKKTEAYGSYFYNNLAINNQSKSLTQRFNSNPDSTQDANQTSGSLNKSQNHRFNYNIEMPIDSNTSLIIRPNVSYQQTSNQSTTNTNTTLNKTTDLSNVDQRTNSDNNGYNGTLDATLRHRFKTKGRTYSINLTGSGSSNKGDGSNYSTTVFGSATRIADQENNSNTDAKNISTTLSYTEPIGKNQLLEIGYNYSYKINNADKYTYANTVSGYTLPVDSLTNTFKNINYSNRVTLGYRIQNAKYNLGITSGVQLATLNSTNQSKDTGFRKNFTNLYPTANFTYNFSRTSNLRVNYSGRTNQPSVSQLQPVPDNSDQTNVVTGNPNLSQSFVHSLRVFYTSFDVFKVRNIFVVLNLSATSHAIVSDITQYTSGAKAGTQRTTYANLNGNYSATGYFNYGFQLPNPKSNLNFSTNVSYNRSVSLINKAINYNNNTTLGETIGWTMNLKEKLDLNLTATSTYNIVKNSIQVQSNSDYFTQSLSAEPTYTFKGGWVLGSTFDYTFYTGRTEGYNTSVPLWNASFSKLLFKKQNGELKFSMYDLLNQNVSITRTVTNNSVQDVQTNVLQRYFSVTFTYNLRKFAGQQPAIPGQFKNMMRANGNMMRRMMN